jgi:Bacterial protein of unknown function (DUF916)
VSHAPSTRNVALALAIAALLTLAHSPVGLARGTGGFSVRPAETSANDPTTRSYFKPVLAPGTSMIRHVIVANGGPTPLVLLVSAVDGRTGQTTGTVYANMQDPVRKAGAWLSPQAKRITVPAHSETKVGFAIRVPAQAQPGDHVAGIAFQDAQPKTSGGRFRIVEIVRAVVGVAIRVPGPATPGLSLGRLALKGLPGTIQPSVVVGVGNAGRLLCQPKLAVSLRDPGGHRRAVVRQLDTVLPGDAVSYPLPWPATLSSGSYGATASMSCDGRTVTRSASLTLGKTLVHGHGSRPSRRGGLPMALLLAAVAIVGVLAGVLLGRGRRGRAPVAPVHPPAPHLPAAHPEPAAIESPSAPSAARSDDSDMLPDPGRIVQEQRDSAGS